MLFRNIRQPAVDTKGRKWAADEDDDKINAAVMVAQSLAVKSDQIGDDPSFGGGFAPGCRAGCSLTGPVQVPAAEKSWPKNLERWMEVEVCVYAGEGKPDVEDLKIKNKNTSTFCVVTLLTTYF